MNRSELETAVKECLTAIVPGVDLDAVDPSADLREEIELDSMDMFNFVVALHKELGVDIPEVDVPKLVTLEGAVDYLSGKLAG
jgi:acyl carrier protein